MSISGSALLDLALGHHLGPRRLDPGHLGVVPGVEVGVVEIGLVGHAAVSWI
jgi:hypothetical protein